jgi:ribose-phosphate pyrophosphokinase
MINLDDITEITFPDGQTHIKIDPLHPRIFNDPGFVDVDCRIRTPQELFKLLMLQEILIANNYIAKLHIKYLMAARMDRAIDQNQPFTLKTVCDVINKAFPRSPIDVFCPHSDTVSILLHNFVPTLSKEIDFYSQVIQDTLNEHGGNFTLVLPDAGAGKRWHNNFGCFNEVFEKYRVNTVECSKKRDMQTGALSKFIVPENVNNVCLIIDDLCDGGFTFVKLAESLRKRGAKRIGLAVCHGIFSKGTTLEGIDKIYTTNSYKNWITSPNFKVVNV